MFDYTTSPDHFPGSGSTLSSTSVSMRTLVRPNSIHGMPPPHAPSSSASLYTAFNQHSHSLGSNQLLLINWNKPTLICLGISVGLYSERFAWTNFVQNVKPWMCSTLSTFSIRPNLRISYRSIWTMSPVIYTLILVRFLLSCFDVVPSISRSSPISLACSNSMSSAPHLQ